MITTRLYLDARAVAGTDADAPIKIQITKRGKTALLPTGVKVAPSQWDKHALKIVKHPSKNTLNAYIFKMQLRVDDLIREMVLDGRAAELSSTEIKNAIHDVLLGQDQSVNVRDYFFAFAEKKSRSTCLIYKNNFKVIEKFDERIATRNMQAVTPEWAQRFADWLSEHYSANTRRQILGNCNAVFNLAVDDHVVAKNPFKGIKLAYVVTRKRNLTQQQLRLLWNAETFGDRERVSLDLFKFSFLTIAMNSVDIAGLTPKSVFNGRIEYDRAKTGKHYSIAIVDELRPLLDKYADGELLFNPFKKFANHYNMVTSADQALTRIARRIGLPDISLYWARHTWATLAAQLDVPVDVISSALGHSHGARVTMVYINVDTKKIDDANRRVIDFALYDDLK